MTTREKILIAIIGVLLCGLAYQDRVEAQNPAVLFAIDSASGAATPIQTNGTNAIKILGK